MNKPNSGLIGLRCGDRVVLSAAWEQIHYCPSQQQDR